ncbi:hypothetical protein GCM10009804_66000 [Kribbella hippodromi]|uniref:MFS transporter n=2 Tax=Kribbella hippodromi TaxID=434347 RepID=A0ABP4Q7L1_9ACTN
MLFTEQPSTGFAETALFGVLLGCGAGLANAPTNSAVIDAVGRQRSGTGSATVNATRQSGTTLGIAVLGSVIASAPTHTVGLHRIAGVSAAIGLALAAIVTVTRRKAF